MEWVWTLALKKADVSLEYLKDYEKKRKQEFEKKFLLSRILQKLIYNQFFCDKVVRILKEKRELADILVGVIGDLVPGEKVISLRFLSQLLGVCPREKSKVNFVGWRV